MGTTNNSIRIIVSFCLVILFSACSSGTRSGKPQKVRISRLVIDSTQLASYKILLKEEIETSVNKEPGVLTLYAVFEKENPTHLTILEIYETEQAYQSHLKTAHFLKYKKGSLDMVKDLQLIDTDPLIPELKIK